MKTPYGKLAKIYAKNFGHMTKMTATSIYGKPFNNLPLQNQKAYDLGTWYVALGKLGLPICSDDDPRLTLTYLTSRSNLLPMHLNGNFLIC